MRTKHASRFCLRLTLAYVGIHTTLLSGLSQFKTRVSLWLILHYSYVGIHTTDRFAKKHALVILALWQLLLHYANVVNFI